VFLLSSSIKILELEEAISEMKIIHVAGTKGKVAVLNFCQPMLASIYQI
jgi:folylpolyglutamate synthase